MLWLRMNRVFSMCSEVLFRLVRVVRLRLVLRNRLLLLLKLCWCGLVLRFFSDRF